MVRMGQHVHGMDMGAHMRRIPILVMTLRQRVVIAEFRISIWSPYYYSSMWGQTNAFSELHLWECTIWGRADAAARWMEI